MYRRLLLVAVLSLLTTACAPYGGNGYYRTEVYTAERYGYPGYYRPDYPYNRGYYVVPQPRYYAPPPRYYSPPRYHAPSHQYRPAPHYGRPTPHYYRAAPERHYQPYPNHRNDRYRQGPSRHDRDRDGRQERSWHR
ncbi:hypothetical protein [Pseudomonas sp. H9]|uniref:hypothetical protein n=1 Tax=Pseudomonas sp. H9 TaxID=483968 RepID=UPI00105823E8|nr:hypothetical protein [Pseudomonas sp. H9]TDF81729.1 hypothetical protein E1573_16555 [Pseudomonas sp. H9]